MFDHVKVFWFSKVTHVSMCVFLSRNDMYCTCNKAMSTIVSSLCLFSSYPSSHWHWHTLKNINTLLNWTVLCRILSELGYEECYLILTGHVTVHAKQQHEPVYVSTREKRKFLLWTNSINWFKTVVWNILIVFTLLWRESSVCSTLFTVASMVALKS